jgi:putative NADPH-quinone reductase
MPNVLIILGHPRSDSYCGALAAEYAIAARDAGAVVERLDVTDLQFDPIADVSYWSGDWDESMLEVDLLKAIDRVRWADRIVLVFPLWWGFIPTLFKGFFDRAFSVPGFGADADEKGRPIGLLKGRRATLVVTHDAPVYWEKWFMRNRGIGIIRRSILGLCGIKTDRILQFGPMYESTDAHRAGWLKRTAQAARADANR